MNGPENKTTVTAVEDRHGNKAMRAEATGILMHPNIAADWDTIVPGSAKGIYQMARAEQKHRIIANYLGLLFGFVVGVGTLGVAAYLAYQGSPLVGLGAIVGPLAIIAAAALGAAKISKH